MLFDNLLTLELMQIGALIIVQYEVFICICPLPVTPAVILI